MPLPVASPHPPPHESGEGLGFDGNIILPVLWHHPVRRHDRNLKRASSCRVARASHQGESAIERPFFRRAGAADCRSLAQLFILSSDGLADYLWRSERRRGESTAEACARAYADGSSGFSYRDCLVAEVQGRILAMAHSFVMQRGADAEPAKDPVLRPYSELEDHGSFYLSSLAVAEGARGRGLGTRLMRMVEEEARDLGLPRVSLICFERNIRGMRFYQRLGYRERDRRAIVPHPCLGHTGGDAVLLVRPVQAMQET